MNGVTSATFGRGTVVTAVCLSLVNRIIVYLITGLCAVMLSWWRGTVVECRSLTGELSLSCAQPAADG